jgi:transposase-like protein
MYAETLAQARDAAQRFATEYGPKYPKAVETLEKDADVLLTFFDFPAEHWKHLRTSNVIESPTRSVRSIAGLGGPFAFETIRDG